MTATKRKVERERLTVTKTISLPLSTVEAVLDEAELMRASFSEATNLLLWEGIRHRRAALRAQEESDLARMREGARTV